MRLRKQKEVQKENEFYMQLLQQALPPEQQMLQRQEREAEEGKPETHKQTTCTHLSQETRTHIHYPLGLNNKMKCLIN